MALRDHECVSVDSLVHCLKGHGHQVQVKPEEHDPPDFWLFIDGKKFAVEETSIAEEKVVSGIAAARKNGRISGSLGWKWEGETQDTLSELIQGRVQQKRKRLENKGVLGDISILLFYDAYGFGDEDDAKIALQKVHGHDWFHSVFWAASFADKPNELYPEKPGRRGSFLYTKEGRWKEVGCPAAAQFESTR